MVLARYWLVSLILAGAAFAAERPPNIVFILADDLGYGDLHCYNPEKGKILTPNLDRLAAEGMRFTDCHSPSSVCSPTRYGLLTGRYAWRTRLQNGVLKPYDEPLIAADRLTLPALLKRHGYSTACIGKWHLGWNWPRAGEEVVFDRPIAEGPTARGFDYYFGTNVPNQPPYCFIENDRTVGLPTARKEQRNLDGQPGPELPGWRREEILPTLVERSIAYLQERSARPGPFFLYLPLTSPHEPIAPTPEFQGKSGISRVADFIMETDWAIGRVLEAIGRHGLAENTLVVFTADNGHCTYTERGAAILSSEGHVSGHYPSGPWRGFKSDAWEGGHRVPMIIRWPGKVRPAAVCDSLVCLTDWVATVAELLGNPLPSDAGEDSVSFLPLLTQASPGRRVDIVNHSAQGRFAIRRGAWKLILGPGSGGYGAQPPDKVARETGLPPIQLYNLEADPGETRNVQAEHPNIVKELTRLLDELIERGRSTPGPPQKNDVDVRRQTH
jgi:arylsulfatase A-like enzyme